ncbi:M20/M25/M40 family metallo-hydrolase [bacterium]|nr:M20/M25/M40 family metallo-hydrolase [bacterium]
MSTNSPVDAQKAEQRLMSYLSVEGVTGHESAIANLIIDDLKSLGVSASSIKFDDAHKRIPLPTETGNLIVTLPGTRTGDRLLFATHLDTVPLCAGAKPKKAGDRIVSDWTTALGGDNRTGCAVLVTLVETLLKQNLPHPPITLLFTVREESGLHGARELNPVDLDGAIMGFNVDGKIPADLIVGAVGQESWDVEIHGQAAHAGVAPEKGISSTLVASVAITEAHRNGWFGKVVKPEGKGTSNVGIFGGKGDKAAGDATNVVTDYVHIKGEARSSDAKFASKITEAFRTAFSNAEREVKDIDGNTSTVKFTAKAAYPPFTIPEDSAVVKHASRAAEAIGLKAKCVYSNGGLDANWFVNHGVPTVTIGAGQYEIHTVKEYVLIEEFIQGCQLAVSLATID